MDVSIQSMRKGLENGEFMLYYQPKYDLFFDRITGVEALIRWKRQNGELIPPNTFLPVAEASGWISQLGDWILRTAVHQAVNWRLAGYQISVAINVSPNQILSNELASDFLTTLDVVMQDAGAIPTDIELEVTEGIAISSAGIVWVDALKSRGISLAIDDFGTGYSSLAYLKSFSAHTLKIDKLFIDNAPSNLSDCLLLEAMINIGHSFGMVVVAEGVENEEQKDFLKYAGCDVIQGYFYSKPLRVNEIESLLNINDSYNI